MKNLNELLEKLITHQLTDTERNSLLKNLQNEDLAEQAYILFTLKESLAKNDDNAFRKILREVEYEEQHRSTTSITDLQPHFSPVEEYESNLEGITRGVEVSVIAPKPYVNCIDSLQFELEFSQPHALLLLIENNDYDELTRAEVPARMSIFEISLSDPEKFHPGRYYWKLIDFQQQLVAMGVFFIGKGLMIN